MSKLFEVKRAPPTKAHGRIEDPLRRDSDKRYCVDYWLLLGKYCRLVVVNTIARMNAASIRIYFNSKTLHFTNGESMYLQAL